MSLIQHLNQNVTPKLSSMLSADINIDSLLEQYYAILGTRLTDGRLLSQLTNITKNPTFEQVWDDAHHRQTMIQELAETHHIHENTVAQLISVATPLIYKNIYALSHSEMMPIAEYLRKNFEEMRGYLPAWVGMVIPTAVLKPNALKQHSTSNQPSQNLINPNSINTNSINTSLIQPKEILASKNIDNVLINSESVTDDSPVSESAQYAQPSQYPSVKSSGLGTIVKVVLPVFACGAIGVGCWLWFGGQSVQIPFLQSHSGETFQSIISLSKAPIPPTIQPAMVRVTSNANGGLFACYSSIGNGTLQSQVIADISNEFGNMMTNSCTFNIVGGQAGYDTTLPALKSLPDMLAMIQSVPFASVEFTGDEIRLNAPDEDLLEQLVTEAKLLAPDLKVLSQSLKVNYVAQSIYTARNALSVLSPDSPPQSIAQALSLAEFEFSDDGGQNVKINGNAHEILNEAAILLKQSPDMLMLIMVHTNNTFSPDMATLRANAIKQYLISQGVADSQLITNGLADQYPIADNETALGRVLNNRSEFIGYSLSAQAGNPINKFGYYQGITTITDRYQAGSSNTIQKGKGQLTSHAQVSVKSAHKLNNNNQSIQNTPDSPSVFRIENGQIIEGYSSNQNNNPNLNQAMPNMQSQKPEQANTYGNQNGNQRNNRDDIYKNEPQYGGRQELSQSQLLAEEANSDNQYREPYSEPVNPYMKQESENNPMIEAYQEESKNNYISSASPDNNADIVSNTSTVESAALRQFKELADRTIVAEPVNGGTIVSNDY